MFLELSRINISYFEREDSSEYRKYKVFRLGPESKNKLLKVKVAKYKFKSCNFYFLKCKDSLQDCNTKIMLGLRNADRIFYKHL